MQATKRQIKLLQPFLLGERPRNNGEWDMYCPLHEDTTRSASLNTKKGMWICFKGCGAGSLTDLLRRRAEWVTPGKAATNGYSNTNQEKPDIVLSEGLIGGWHAALMSHTSALPDLIDQRGLTSDTLARYEIGWMNDRRLYTIPVRAPDGEIWNVRYYNIRPTPGRRKIWGTTGYNSPPRLYPISVFDSDPGEIILGEGEWDVLLAIQCGYPAITRTGAADVWDSGWGEWFAGRTVYLAHDADEKG